MLGTHKRVKPPVGYRCTRRSATGATMVEFALMFPLFLLFIFAILMAAVLFSSRASLTSAVNSARLALTRGQAELSGDVDGVIAQVTNWRSGGAFPAILSTPNESAQAQAYYDDVTGGTGGIYSGVLSPDFTQCTTGGAPCSFANTPDQYIYAHVYTVLAMKQSVGELRYPCDPDDPLNGQGCLLCKNLTASRGDITPEDPFDGPKLLDPNYELDWVGITCRFRPGKSILRILENLVSLTSGSNTTYTIVFERTGVFLAQS